MKTLRLLLWLRWRLFLSASTMGGRIATVALTGLLLTAFSPFWLGGAILAWKGVRDLGAAPALLTFGACQIVWLWMGLVSGALGRSFDLDKFMRYPVRPRTVFAINIFASLLEPICLMTVPALAAVAIATGQRAGALAGLTAGLAGVLLALITATMLQVLLALLDELLRREWMRYAAATVLPLTFLGMQLVLSRGIRSSVEQFMAHRIDGPTALSMAAEALRWVPTLSAPAAVVAGALDGSPWRVLAGFAGSVTLLAAGILPGAALMKLTVRAGESAGGSIGPARTSARGTYAVLSPPLPRTLGLLLAREIRYSMLNPQRFISVLLTPLLVLVLSVGRGERMSHPDMILVVMLASSACTASLLLFGYDGPGVRSIYLLPVPPRDVLLAKSLELFLRLGMQFLLASVAVLWVSHHAPDAGLFAVLLGLLALVLGILTVGTSFSIRFPQRVRTRGMNTRSGGWTGFALIGIAGVLGGVVFGLGWLVRRATGPAMATPATLALYAAFVLAAGAIWWRSLDIHAVLLGECREKLIEEIGKTTGE